MLTEEIIVSGEMADKSTFRKTKMASGSFQELPRSNTEIVSDEENIDEKEKEKNGAELLKVFPLR